MSAFELSSYISDELGHKPVPEGKKSIAEILEILKGYTLPKPLEEYGDWGAPPAFMIKVSDNNFITVRKPSSDQYSIYFYYVAGNVDISEINFENLNSLFNEYSTGSYFRLFKKIAKSGDAYTMLGSGFKSTILGLLLKL